MTRREDILAALLDPLFVRVDHVMPPRYRRAVQPLLGSRALNAEMPSELRQRAGAVLDVVTRVARAGRVLTLTDIANMLAEQVFLALAGIAHDRELGLAVSERRTPLLAGLSESLDDAEAVQVVEYLVMAGHGGISHVLQIALVELYGDPDLGDELRADPQRIAGYVDDLFGHRSLFPMPFPIIVRATTAPATVAGVAIPAGSQVELCIGALGDKQGSGHLEFGAGAHRCIGRHLSNLALTVFIEEWLRLVPRSQLRQLQ